MAVKCGWASIDERGSASGGKAGDQTGREVRTGNWYDFGQTAVYRWKNKDNAKKFAKCIESLCNNSADGYDQGQRTTLNSELKKLGWDYTKLKTKCECDCSSLVVAGVNCVYKKERLSPSLFTGNLGQALVQAGICEKLTGSKYCDSSDYLMVGDIINKPYSHVIVALGNGSKVKTTTAKKTTAKKTTTTKKTTTKKTSSDTKKIPTTNELRKLAYDTMLNKYGTGDTRKKKLGWKYKYVQAYINHIASASTNTLAKEVLHGVYGNGKVRKTLLGKKYNAVQAQVRKMLK